MFENWDHQLSKCEARVENLLFELNRVARKEQWLEYYGMKFLEMMIELKNHQQWQGWDLIVNSSNKFDYCIKVMSVTGLVCVIFEKGFVQMDLYLQKLY